MSRNYYSEINLHIVWHTKESQPALINEVEKATHQCIRQRVIDTPDAFIHEIGGINDHVHLAVTIAPTILVSNFIGQLKGGSGHDANQKLGRKVIQWQAGYGVVSFGKRDLPWVIKYIRNQREHHRVGSIHQRLETIEQREDP
ncbi:MAG: IS200/IS605 family transposase [Lacipirellulaceae bacterium]